jgi:hypothetical protein
MRVSVYFNLHRKLFSIRAEEGPAKGRVIGHARGVTLDNVTYHVGKAGQAKVRETGRKNVHATVRGFITAAFDMRTTDAAKDGMLPWYLSHHHTVSGDVYRAHKLRADYTAKVGEAVRYNPYFTDTFELDDGTPVRGADVVNLSLDAGHHARGAY